MPTNRWEQAANPNNQFDTTGYIYSNIATEPSYWCSLEKLYPDAGFSVDDFWKNFPYANLDAIMYDAGNYFRKALYEIELPMSRETVENLFNL